MQIEMLKQSAPLEALGELLCNQHVVAGAAARLEGEAHLLFADRLFEPLHLFEPLFAAFRRFDRFFAIVHAIAGDDRLLAHDFRLLELVFLQLALEIRLAQARKAIVIALVLRQPPHRKLRHAVADRIQEIAVVRNDQHGALVFLQRVLQPFDRREIQMVRRLVQHQKLRLRQKQSRQAEPRLFAAGQQIRRLRFTTARKSETREHALNAAGP